MNFVLWERISSWWPRHSTWRKPSTKCGHRVQSPQDGMMTGGWLVWYVYSSIYREYNLSKHADFCSQNLVHHRVFSVWSRIYVHEQALSSINSHRQISISKYLVHSHAVIPLSKRSIGYTAQIAQIIPFCWCERVLRIACWRIRLRIREKYPRKMACVAPAKTPFDGFCFGHFSLPRKLWSC